MESPRRRPGRRRLDAGGAESAQLNVRLPPAVFDRLDTVARQRRVSLAHVARVAIVYALKHLPDPDED